MTLKKSSVNPFSFTFWHTCKKNFIIPVVLFIFGIYAFPSAPFSWISHINEVIKSGNSDGYSLLKNTMFVLAREDVQYTGLFLDVLCCVFAALLAVSIFRYAMSKKAVNVYFSLGISRKNMFLSKYLSGVIMLFVSTFVPVMISVIVNIVYFGSNYMLWINALYLFATYFGYMLYCYTVTVMVCCNVGTVFEAIVFGLTLAAIPVVIELLFETFFGNLVYGSIATREYFYDIAKINGVFRFGSSEKFFTTKLLYFSTVDFQESVEFIRYTDEKYLMPDFLSVAIKYVLWAVYFIASSYSYKRRKAEIAGFLGTNTVITSICTFVISAAVIFIAGEIFLSYSRNLTATILICIAILIVVYAVIELVSHRNIKVFFKKMWKLPVHIGVLCVIIAVFSTGFFGYSSKVPEVSEVKSAAISTCTDDMFLFDFNTSGAWSGTNDSSYLSNHIANKTYTADYALTMDEASAAIIEDFTEPEEIEKIIGIHKKLIELKNAEAGEGYGKRITENIIAVSYTLKDGSKLERLFLISNDEIRQQLAALTRTENYINKSADFFLNHLSGAGHLDATLLSKDYTSAYIPENFDEKEETMFLINEIKKDILAGNLPLDYNTDSPVIGYIGFGDGEQGILNREDTIVSFTANDFAITVPVYESMVNTLDLLKKESCISYFETLYEPVKVEKWRLDGSAYKFDYTEFKTSMLYGFRYLGKYYAEDIQNAQHFEIFGSSTVDAEYYYQTESVGLVPFEAPTLAKTAVEVTDPDEKKLLADNIRMITLDCYDGYYVKLVYADGSATYGYVPLSLID